MACKEGQFDVVELMLNDKFKTYMSFRFLSIQYCVWLTRQFSKSKNKPKERMKIISGLAVIRVTLCNLIAQCETLITIQIQWRLLSAFFITWPSLAQSLASLKRHKKSRKIEIREYLDCYCSSLIKQIYITTKRCFISQ